MTEEERTIATWTNVSRLDDQILVEEMVLAAWGGLTGRHEQVARIAALQRARTALVNGLGQPMAHAAIAGEG